VATDGAVDSDVRAGNEATAVPSIDGGTALLISELSAHLARMALFKVNTGLRQREVVNLRWQWEVSIPDIGASVFVIPGSFVKNGLDRYVVLNRTARAVIEACRGEHAEFVFTHDGSPIERMRAARRRAAARYQTELGQPCPSGFRRVRASSTRSVIAYVQRESALRTGGGCWATRQRT
jgi:integrase